MPSSSLASPREELVGAWPFEREDALATIDRHRPDVILLDIQLPDISGLEAARQLKASDLTRMIPIIAVTAFAMREDKRKILDSGCDFYVAKPFRLGELLEAVEMFIAQHRPVISAFDAASSELERSVCIT